MIKTIIFDLGNVIIDVDANRTQAALSQLGVERSEDVFTLTQQNALCDRFERGEITRHEFLSGLATFAQAGVGLNALQSAWEAMILEATPNRLQTIAALRKKYQVFLLSNTNEIHYDTVSQHLREHHAVDQLESLFDRTYLSYQVGHRKPTEAIYQHVLHDANLTPVETLFIDDLPANLSIPQQLGIQTWHAAADLDQTWEKIHQSLLLS